jgi:predicted MFS family arabinose efflux permease
MNDEQPDHFRNGVAATGSRSSAFSLQPSAFSVSWAATLLFFAGFYALLVPLPRYLAAAGLPDWQIGLILGAFGVASLVGRPVAGAAVDRYGVRVVLLVGAAALVVGAGAFVLTTNVMLLFGLRVLQAVGYVAFTTAGTALVIALTPPAERGRRLAVFGAAANVAITATPALVSALIAVAGLDAGFWLATGLAVLAGLLAQTVTSPRREAAPPAGNALQFPRVLWLPMLATGLFGAGFAAFFQFTPLLAERRGVSAGLLYTVYGASIILTRVVGGTWLDRTGLRRVLTVSALVMGAGLALAAVGAEPILLSLAAALVAGGGGLFHPALIAHHAVLVPHAPGRASAAFYVGFDLGIGLGSWVLGFALQVGGLGALYALAALLTLATLPLAPVLGRTLRGRNAEGLKT